MKNFFKRFSHKDRNDSARCRTLEYENTRQRDRIRELEHQLALQKEMKRILQNKLDDVSRLVPGIRQLDPQGVKYLFGDEAKCHEEAGATILSDIAPYLSAGASKIELVLPAGMHFETLSQVVKLLQPQTYVSLSKLVGTFTPDLASGTFLPCIWEDVKNDIGVITARRLTLAPPEQRSFACICGPRISELRLETDEYLRRVIEYRGEELSECQIEEAGAYCDAVLESVCDIWRENFPGVVFPNQSEEEVNTIIERTD